MVTGSPARQRRRCRPPCDCLRHGTPAPVGAHRRLGTVWPGPWPAPGTRQSVPVPLRVSCDRSAPAGRVPRSKTRPTPRLRSPSFGLPRYCTVRQRVFGVAVVGELRPRPGSRSSVVALRIEVPGAGDGDQLPGRAVVGAAELGCPLEATGRVPAESRRSSISAETMPARPAAAPAPAASRSSAAAAAARAGPVGADRQAAVRAAWLLPPVRVVVATLGRTPGASSGAGRALGSVRVRVASCRGSGRLVEQRGDRRCAGGRVDGSAEAPTMRDRLAQPPLQVAGRHRRCPAPWSARSTMPCAVVIGGA